MEQSNAVLELSALVSAHVLGIGATVQHSVGVHTAVLHVTDPGLA